MKWNHRIMRHTVRNAEDKVAGYDYAIHDVMYDGKKLSWTSDPVTVSGANRDEVRKTLKLMLEALKKPILDVENGKEVDDRAKIPKTAISTTILSGGKG